MYGVNNLHLLSNYPEPLVLVQHHNLRRAGSNPEFPLLGMSSYWLDSIYDYMVALRQNHLVDDLGLHQAD
eukprot:2842024-Prorocentrum_lima.AAC.1